LALRSSETTVTDTGEGTSSVLVSLSGTAL